MTTNEPPPSDDSGTSGLPSYGSTPPPPPGAYPPPPGQQPPPGGWPPPPGAPGGYGGMPQGNQKAMWSMIVGIVSILCCGIITGPIAIVLSVQAKKEIAAAHGMQTGDGMAKAGLILGIIAIPLSIVWIVLNLSLGLMG